MQVRVLQDIKGEKACKGRMNKIFSDRGFGFINTPNGNLFVHHSAFPRGEFDQLTEGAQVSYIKGKGNTGKECAVSAKIIG